MLSPTTIAGFLAWQHIRNESLSLTIFDSTEVNAFAIEVNEQNGCLWPLMDKPLELITEQDLLDLTDNQVREDKRTEIQVDA
jgi:hypothetical protein